ncbi:GNAT family N-acetyltransferase [Winogradskyella tangerina]|uniref:GNAT family N-acetyltransferase n=1 Tax=Winogradskyella tangerina TaxID=2023240 RepID=UPI000DBE2AF1|nr:GNAT family N-acetyltransferase [Winogradskyella tangerina]
MIELLRTDSSHLDFEKLVAQLDAYLKITDGDEHEFYNQFNGIAHLNHVVLAYINQKPAGCGAFKAFDEERVEVKRMFTLPEERGRGIASKILLELEQWASELGYMASILETGKRQVEAVNFYKRSNYELIEKYGQYKDMENSLCFQKQLIKV